MKVLRSSLLMASLTLAAPQASGQVFGQFTPAQTVPVNGHLFGAYLHASEDFLGLMTQLRLSFYPDVDFGFHGGLSRAGVSGSDVTTLRLGADFKWRIAVESPIDFAVGGALGVETGDQIHLLTLGPTLVASHSIRLGAGGALTPYAGVGLLFGNSDVRGTDTTDFSVPFRLGSEFQLAPELRLMAEIHLRAHDRVHDAFSFVTGVNLPF